MEEYISNSTEETEWIAERFARTVAPGDVICMYGDLGAGKTAFTRGFARGLGVDGPIVSPTFTIVNEYEGALKLYHFDVYRIDDIDELLDIGFDEYVFGDGVSVIEWAEKIEDILPSCRYQVTISLQALKDDEEDMFAQPPRKILIERIEKHEDFGD